MSLTSGASHGVQYHWFQVPPILCLTGVRTNTLPHQALWPPKLKHGWSPEQCCAFPHFWLYQIHSYNNQFWSTSHVLWLCVVLTARQIWVLCSQDPGPRGCIRLQTVSIPGMHLIKKKKLAQTHSACERLAKLYCPHFSSEKLFSIF